MVNDHANKIAGISSVGSDNISSMKTDFAEFKGSHTNLTNKIEILEK